jgi:hypothetical protein
MGETVDPQSHDPDSQDLPSEISEPEDHELVPSIVGERLTMAAFSQLSGTLSGYPFVKLVVDRPNKTIHFINNAVHQLHGTYIAQRFLGITRAELEADIDRYNAGFYFDSDRDLFLAILSLHHRGDRSFFAIETVEIDTMDGEMVTYLYQIVRENLDPAIPLLFKPANHLQENIVAGISAAELPRVLAHELFSTASYIPLNPGTTTGRLRVFRSEKAYQRDRTTLEWFDIVVMQRVPDDIPRLSGILNADHTTPLSHTNVLASGWQIPNCIQIGIFERIDKEGLDGQWVEYAVTQDAEEVGLKKIQRPDEIDAKPAWKTLRVRVEEPETTRAPIVRLDQLRRASRHKYGTKAANLGELFHLLEKGSDRLTGFYRVRRPPRLNLLPQLAKLLEVPEDADLPAAAWHFLKESIRIPNGIAIPFAFHREFLESSPQIQQVTGKLKMALELEARQVDSLCVTLQQLIRSTRMPERIRSYIDSQVANTLAGVSSFVVRSSSNAEDLENFSAAGIYESINRVTKADTLFESIKQVWASLISPRSVRLRQEVGISLDDCYMGVVIQEEIQSFMGGVLVTANPMKRDDFRNVYLNISRKSVEEVVSGAERPFQYLYNIIEGGGRTLSLGEAQADLDPTKKALLQKLAISGRLLQAHFSPDYTFESPVDIEWLANEEGIHLLQLRPYTH